jgi:hypothetical protein
MYIERAKHGIFRSLGAFGSPRIILPLHGKGERYNSIEEVHDHDKFRKSEGNGAQEKRDFVNCLFGIQGFSREVGPHGHQPYD